MNINQSINLSINQSINQSINRRHTWHRGGIVWRWTLEHDLWPMLDIDRVGLVGIWRGEPMSGGGFGRGGGGLLGAYTVETAAVMKRRRRGRWRQGSRVSPLVQLLDCLLVKLLLLLLLLVMMMMMTIEEHVTREAVEMTTQEAVTMELGVMELATAEEAGKRVWRKVGGRRGGWRRRDEGGVGGQLDRREDGTHGEIEVAWKRRCRIVVVAAVVAAMATTAVVVVVVVVVGGRNGVVVAGTGLLILELRGVEIAQGSLEVILNDHTLWHGVYICKGNWVRYREGEREKDMVGGWVSG